MQTAPLLSALTAYTPAILRPFTGAGGDQVKGRAALEADGAFSDEIETALLAGEIDAAVHCLKDAPTFDTPGLTMSAYLRRDDIRDCLVTREPGATLATLSPGSTIGTASVRRTAALHACRPDLTVIPMRGPIDERLRALDVGAIDAIVVAACSMERLGLTHRIAERIPTHVICPPLGAAIIAVQTREGDTKTADAFSQFHDSETATEAEAERLVLQQLGGFCNAPLAGYCETSSHRGAPTYTVRIRSFAPNGSAGTDVRHSGPSARGAALAACNELSRLGAVTPPTPRG
ncbi:hydroxymethylbilane synthase [Streptomyces sp. 372A]